MALETSVLEPKQTTATILDVRQSKQPSKGRSRVGNFTALLPGLNDARTIQAKRYKEVFRALVSDAGGVERLAEAKLGLMRRWAALECVAEGIEAAILNGQEVDLAAYATLSSTMCRLASRIGLSRKQKDVTPTLEAYLAEIEESEPAEVEPPEPPVGEDE
jgi:hypothetical protein